MKNDGLSLQTFSYTAIMGYAWMMRGILIQAIIWITLFITESCFADWKTA